MHRIPAMTAHIRRERLARSRASLRLIAENILHRGLAGLRRQNRQLRNILHSLGFKMTLFIFVLILCAAYGITHSVTRLLDDVLLDSLLHRGNAITQAAAIPSGFNLLNNDLLALDNLAAQIKASQPDLAYMAILNLQQQVLAHDTADATGGTFPAISGKTIIQTDDSSVTSLMRDGVHYYEFRRAILFAGQTVGYIVIGIDEAGLDTAQAQARARIEKIVLLTLAVALCGVLALVSLFTRPIKQLADGMDRVCRGERAIDLPVTSADELGLLTRRFNAMSAQIEAQQRSLQQSSAELEASYNDIVRILAAALDARDNYTYGHSTRVAHFALGIGKALGLESEALHELEMSCLLHDIGKIKVPDAILNKQGRLTDDEYHLIIAHPEHGAEILSLSGSLHKYIPAVRHHHERYDGQGYPDKLTGDAIPLHAQIIALADTYDAMTIDRPYRPGRDDTEAAAEILTCRGSQFNPQLVDVFLSIRYQLLAEEIHFSRSLQA